MSTSPFYAKDHSLNVQTFLYACAFWAVAGDEKLKPAEQEWLKEQFGAAGATRSLEEFVALESDAFFEAFQRSAESLTDGEKRSIFPRLEEWLNSCVESDGSVASEEKAVIRKIKERLNLDAEILRLTGAPPAKAPPTRAKPPRKVRRATPPPPAGQTPDALASDRLLQGHSREVTDVRASACGKFVLSASDDNDVKLWDFQRMAEIRTCGGHELGVAAVSFLPDSKRFLSGDRLGTLRLWSMDTGEPVWSRHKKGQGGISSLDVSPDGQRVAFATDAGLVLLYDVATGEEIRRFGASRLGTMRTVRFSPDGKMILFGGDDRLGRLWDVSGGTELRTFAGHEDGVTSVAFRHDGALAATGSRDNTVRTWEVASGREIRNLEAHSFNVHGVDFSPDGRWMVSGSWDHSVKIWDTDSGRELLNMDTGYGRINSVGFHPNGEHLLAASSENVIHVVRLPKQ